MKQRKKFKDTGIGRFLAATAPDVLETVGDYFPPAKILSQLVNKSKLDEQQKAVFDKLLSDYQMEYYKLDASDRASARSIYPASKDMSDSLADRIINWNLPVIGLLVVVNIVSIIYLDKALLAIVSNIIGGVVQLLANERLTVINFFFGSSKGSSDKTDIITNFKQNE